MNAHNAEKGLPTEAVLREAIRAVIAKHRTTLTRELLQCACGWYAKRGPEAHERYAGHLARTVAPVLLAESILPPAVGDERGQA